MINFLHLTDLHFGLAGQKTLWPNTGNAFYEDLRRLRETAGPWHVVFFTGDLVQQGREDEFDALDQKILDPLWEEFDALGCNPVLLTVPGNHDLVRPAGTDPATLELLQPDAFAKIGQSVFTNRSSPHRQTIDEAFANYRRWWTARMGSTGLQFGEELMPGDFAVTLTINSHRLGVVGLNTTFLQLAGGDYEGKLVVAQDQLHHACGGNGAEWVKRHDACILLTHQGANWLTPASRVELEREINPPERFAIHLFGHEHQVGFESRARAGTKAWRTWQGPSLFGLEKMGDPPVLDRRHGYSAGRLDFRGGKGFLRLWPRKAVATPRWRFIPDHESMELEDDGATSPVSWQPPLVAQDLRRPTDRLMWRLSRAQEDLEGQLKQLDRGDVVELHHIGLDMSQAHTRLVEMVQRVLTDRFAIAGATLKLLVLEADVDKYGDPVPESLRKMTKSVAASVDHVVDGLRDLDQGYTVGNKKLAFEVRSYHERPTIHGFSLVRTSKPAGPIATYLSFCRWKEDGSDLDWGAMKYRRVLGNGTDHASTDLIAIFRGTFAHLWATSEPLHAFVIGKKS